MSGDKNSIIVDSNDSGLESKENDTKEEQKEGVSTKESKEVENIMREEADFDFIEWLEKRQGVNKKMRDFASSDLFDPKDIPWPKVKNARTDGVI